jgi:hypothetical protein
MLPKNLEKVERLTDIVVEEVSIVPKGANNRTFLIFKSANNKRGMKMPIEPEPKGAVEKAGADGVLVPKDFDEIQKSLNEERESRERLEKALGAEKTAREALEKKLSSESEEKGKLLKQITEEREVRLRKEFIQKASDDMPALGSSEILGPILKEASEKMSPDSYKELEKTLIGANTKIVEGELFEEIGKSGADSSGGSAWSKIEKAAKEMVAKDSKMSMGAAVEMVCKQHPDWYDEHLEEVA